MFSDEGMNAARVRWLETVLPGALSYHYGNYLRLERAGCPDKFDIWDQFSSEKRNAHFNAQQSIKYEAAAYISQVGKLIPFIDEKKTTAYLSRFRIHLITSKYGLH